MARERRRYPRFVTALPVLVKERQGAAQLLTADVSRHGAFILTDSPWPERELVMLSFQLPDGEPLELMGMVARRVRRDACAERPGMGIDFFALSAEAKERWDKFILGLANQPVEPREAETPPAPAPTRRRHPRRVSCFLVRLKDKERLREFYTRDLSGGGMFLKTPVPQQVSTQVELILVHPGTDEEFQLAGRVVRTVEGPALSDRGVGIAFEELPAEREASLLTFIETGVNYLERLDGTRAERVSMLRRAVQAMRDVPVALVKLGEALLHEVETEAAVEALRYALEVDPHHLDAHRGLYKAYTMLDDPEHAREHLEAIRRLERG